MTTGPNVRRYIFPNSDLYPTTFPNVPLVSLCQRLIGLDELGARERQNALESLKPLVVEQPANDRHGTSEPKPSIIAGLRSGNRATPLQHRNQDLVKVGRALLYTLLVGMPDYFNHIHVRVLSRNTKQARDNLLL